MTPGRNPHFQTTNLNLGEQGRIPPTLTGVGAKLKSNWMRDVLVNGRSIRPYMKTRMPQFGEENIGHLIELFQQTDKLPETRFADFDDQKEMRKLGLTIAGNKGLNCVACHTYQYKLSDTMPAVDLTEMTERLKKDWFYQYMLVPQKFSPNTVMPSFWPGGKAIRNDIEGDPEFQIEALWQYLIDGRQAGMPSGVVREPLEIVVTDEAQMLRRSYPGIGKRGIGVGYPGGVNLAFDAEQMRLAMIWKGKFADPGGVWRGQGHGNVRPMERPFDFAKARNWMICPIRGSSMNPDHLIINSRVMNWIRFAGQRLSTISKRLTSAITFCKSPTRSKQSGFAARSLCYLRTTVTSWVFESGRLGDFRVSGRVIFCWQTAGRPNRSDHKARIVDATEGKLLQIPVNLTAGKLQTLTIEYVWK